MRFPLVRAAGEQVPLRDASFDLVISEYGAAIWADPYRWIPEAARLLRRGGELVFLGNSTLLMLCAPDEDGVPAAEYLLRPQFGMYRFEWPDDPTVEFHLAHGDWIRLLRSNGFEVEDLIEFRPPELAPRATGLSSTRMGQPMAVRGGVARPCVSKARQSRPACSTLPQALVLARQSAHGVTPPSNNRRPCRETSYDRGRLMGAIGVVFRSELQYRWRLLLALVSCRDARRRHGARGAVAAGRRTASAFPTIF